MGPKKPKILEEGIPAAVSAAAKLPIATSIPQIARNSLLPYLALGFTPVKTSGGGNLCGINALQRSFKEARIALNPPGTPKIKNADHIGQAGFRKLLRSARYNAIVQEHLKSTGIDEMMEGPQKKALIDDMFNLKDLDISQLILLLRLANEDANTNFQLGTITGGYRCRLRAEVWDTDFIRPTHVVVLGEGDGRPIIWLYNDNGVAADEAWGRNRGSAGHWEAFGPADASDTTHRNVVQNWNLAQLMRDDIATGVWWVTAEQDGSDGQLAVKVGAFVREAKSPPGVNVPIGWRYMSTADDQNFGLVAVGNVLQIEVHRSAPTPVENGADPINPEVIKVIKALPGSDSNKTDNYHADQNAAMLAALSSINILATKFHIFRTIKPTNKVGDRLTDKELRRYTRDDFNFEDGHFLLDLGQREDSWVRVRTIDGNEGWAHARRLQSLENPWSLPGLMPFLQLHLSDDSWNAARIVEEARKRGLDTIGNTDEVMTRIVAWQSLRTEYLPMRLVDGDGNGKTSILDQYLGPQFLEREIVLEIRNDAATGNVEVIGFDKERGMIDSLELHEVPEHGVSEVPWNLWMTPEDLAGLLKQFTQAVAGNLEVAAIEGGGNGGAGKHPIDAGENGEPPMKKQKT